jgi:hypothetical protein
MKIIELLLEKRVASTWISELIHNRPNKRVTMKLSNGRAFSVFGITRAAFEKWSGAESKGKYWHLFIKGSHRVTRIK